MTDRSPPDVRRSALGRFLERQLADDGLSPAVFAARAGLSVSHVYQLIRGDRADPRSTTFRKVASALDMSEADLARAVFAQPPPPAATSAADSSAVDRATFFSLMSAFPSGVTVVTSLNQDHQPRGLTCTATCSLSAAPPLLLVCIDQRSGTLAAIRHSRRFIVNYLLAGRGELANRFASRDPERWTQLAWRPTPTGLPWLYADSLAYAECALFQEMSSGDHVVVVGRVEGGQSPAPGSQPLMYFRRGYGTWRT